MANLDNPSGFMPVMRSQAGGEISLMTYKKAAGYGTAIFAHDVVNQVADGTIERSITPATTLVSGVTLTPGAASTATEHRVIDDPFAIFIAQGDNNGQAKGVEHAGSVLLEADAGLNCNVILRADTPLLQIGTDEIDASTKATTLGLDLKLLRRFNDGSGQNEYGAFSRWEVRFNNHRMAFGTAGV